MASLNLFDRAQANHFLERLRVGKLLFEEENRTFLGRVTALTNVQVVEEDQLVICHAHESLAVAQGCQDFARAFDDHFPCRRLV